MPKNRLLEDEEEENTVFVSQNVDKDGIFYTALRMPDKLQTKLEKYYDKKNDNYWFQEDEWPRVKKYLKKKGKKVRVAKLAQMHMSLGEALDKTEEDPTRRMKTPYKQLNDLLGGKGFVRGGI